MGGFGIILLVKFSFLGTFYLSSTEARTLFIPSHQLDQRDCLRKVNGTHYCDIFCVAIFWGENINFIAVYSTFKSMAMGLETPIDKANHFPCLWFKTNTHAPSQACGWKDSVSKITLLRIVAVTEEISASLKQGKDHFVSF